MNTDTIDGRRSFSSRSATLLAPPSWLLASAAVVVPGGGHLLLGHLWSGLAWLGAVSLLGAIVGGAWQALPRLWRAVAVMGLPPEAAVWTVGAAAAAIALFHSASVLSARALAPDATPHPVLACAASALVPGWGQVLNRDLVRAGLLLVGAWTVVIAWVLASHPVQEMLSVYRLQLPAPLSLLGAAPARWALVAGLWPLAVYDAGASAYMARRYGN
jgi:hypothetical protein